MAKKRYKSEQVAIDTTFKPKFWDEADGRYGVVREIRKRYEALKQDTNANSFQKDLICQRATFIAIQLETMESNAIDSGQLEVGVYTQCVNALVGLLKSLGLEKQMKEAIVDLKSYVEGQQK